MRLMVKSGMPVVFYGAGLVEGRVGVGQGMMGVRGVENNICPNLWSTPPPPLTPAQLPAFTRVVFIYEPV